MDMKAFKIDTLDISVAKRYEAGEISLREAAQELYKAGWTNFVDESYAQKIINRYEQKNNESNNH